MNTTTKITTFPLKMWTKLSGLFSRKSHTLDGMFTDDEDEEVNALMARGYLSPENPMANANPAEKIDQKNQSA